MIKTSKWQLHSYHLTHKRTTTVFGSVNPISYLYDFCNEIKLMESLIHVFRIPFLTSITSNQTPYYVVDITFLEWGNHKTTFLRPVLWSKDPPFLSENRFIFVWENCIFKLFLFSNFGLSSAPKTQILAKTYSKF